MSAPSTRLPVLVPSSSQLDTAALEQGLQRVAPCGSLPLVIREQKWRPDGRDEPKPLEFARLLSEVRSARSRPRGASRLGAHPSSVRAGLAHAGKPAQDAQRLRHQPHPHLVAHRRGRCDR